MDGHVPKLVLVFQPPLDLSTLRTAQEESVISLLPLLKDIPEAFAADPDGFSATIDHALKVKVAKIWYSKCMFLWVLASFSPL